MHGAIFMLKRYPSGMIRQQDRILNLYKIFLLLDTPYFFWLAVNQGTGYFSLILGHEIDILSLHAQQYIC